MDKNTLRIYQKHKRKTALAQTDTAFVKAIYTHITSVICKFSNTMTVGGYYPITTEIDVLPLLACIKNPTALPCAIADNTPLTFRMWSQGDRLSTDIYNIPCPIKTAQIVTPDILLVPLLAFDTYGYRLGYGGGFYDRTIATQQPTVTIGVGLSCLQVDTVPTEHYDRPLNYIVTEQHIIQVA